MRLAYLKDKPHNLQRHIPSLAGMLETGGKGRILQLLFKIVVKIGYFHHGILLCQSFIRSRAMKFYTEFHNHFPEIPAIDPVTKATSHAE